MHIIIIHAVISNEETDVRMYTVSLSIQNDEIVVVENSDNDYTEEPV